MTWEWWEKAYLAEEVGAVKTLKTSEAAFEDVWREVEKAWANQVKLSDTSERLMVNAIWNHLAEQPYNLLGPTALTAWVKEILATSKDWQAFQVSLDDWHFKNRNSFEAWLKALEAASCAWQAAHVALAAWQPEDLLAFRAWHIIMKTRPMKARATLSSVDTVSGTLSLMSGTLT
jgi:hypothetical protein